MSDVEGFPGWSEQDPNGWWDACCRVCRALGLLERLDALVPEGAAGPMAQLRLQGRKRQRATGRKASVAAAKKWTWGDGS